jgi:hypothetical protein
MIKGAYVVTHINYYFSHICRENFYRNKIKEINIHHNITDQCVDHAGT